jgi:hypothetical protein
MNKNNVDLGLMIFSKNFKKSCLKILKKNLLIIQNLKIFCLKNYKKYTWLIKIFKNKTEKIKTNKVKIKSKLQKNSNCNSNSNSNSNSNKIISNFRQQKTRN